MRSVDPSLLTKLGSQEQTISNSADPKMFVAVARARNTVVDSTYWTVETIREGVSLGDVSVAARRFKVTGPPNRIYEIHVDGGVVGTSIREYPDKLKDGFIDQFSLGSGSAVAIAFDGRWERHRESMRLITEEEPWIAWVDSSGVLWTQLWDDATTKLQLDTSVAKVRALRAWKNINYADRDQGIVVGYIKTDGSLWYRNYCQQADTTYIWESAKEVTDFTGTSAVNLNLFITNDYRMGFAVEDNLGQIHWLITDRNWSGMAIMPDIIATSLTDLSVDLIPVAYKDGYDNEIIAGSITDLIMDLYWAGETLPVKAENIATTDTVTAEAVGTGDGSETVFSLLHEPLTQTIYVDAVEVTNYTVNGEDITFAAAPTGAITADYTWANWGKRIKITMDHGVTDVTGTHSAFAVEDSASTPFYPTAIADGEAGANTPSTFDGSDEFILTVGDFNNATNPLTVTFTTPGPKGEAGQAIASFEIEFTATNLKPIAVDPPEVEAIWNE
jgi:hypothetical protein